MVGRLALVIVIASLAVLSAGVGQAADRLVVSSGHQGGWDALVVAFGERKGFFRDKGLEIDNVDMDTGRRPSRRWSPAASMSRSASAWRASWAPP